MSKKNPYSNHEKEINNLALQYEQSLETNEALYMDAEDMADLADWYFTNHQDAMAWGVLELGLRIHGDNTALLVEKANLLIEENKLDEAIDIADLITDVDDDEAIVLQAKIMMLQGADEDAKILLEEKKSIVDIIGVAFMYMEVNQPEEAMKWLKMGNMEEDDDESYLAALGDCYQALGEHQKAIPVIEKLLDIDPYSASYWHGLSICYYHLDQLQKALEAADYAIVSDEEYGGAYAQRGDIYQMLGNRDRAIADYRKAVELRALKKEFLDIYALEDLIGKGKWEEAIEILQREANDKSRSDEYRSESAVQTAYCLIKQNKNDEAAKWVKKSLKLDKNNVTAYIIQGRLYLQQADEKKAVDTWKKALKIEPFDTTWERIASHCLSLQRFDYVEVCYECVKQIRPDDKYVDLVLAIVNLVMGNEKKFEHYNNICEHPLSDQKVNEYKRMLKTDNKEMFVEALYQILRDNFNNDPYLNQ